MVWFFLKIWHEECQDNSVDPTILNATSNPGLTDVNVLKDPPEIFLCLPKQVFNDEEKLINTVTVNSKLQDQIILV